VRKLLTLLMIAVVIFLGFMAATFVLAETLFRCSGQVELYTNVAEYGCPVYAPHSTLGIVRHGATREEIFQKASGSVTVPARMPTEQFITPKVCTLYAEWLALNERTVGGTLNQTTQDRQRWQALARMFTVVGIPVACKD